MHQDCSVTMLWRDEQGLVEEPSQPEEEEDDSCNDSKRHVFSYQCLHEQPCQSCQLEQV